MLISSIGGLAPVIPLRDILAEERRQAEAANNAPVVQALAAHVRSRWEEARRHKEQDVEQRMLRSLRQKKGEYDPDLINQIREQGSSEIYMGLSSVKARAAASWLRDVLLGSRGEKPWLVTPTPVADLPEDEVERAKTSAFQEAQQIEIMGQGVTPETLYAIMKRTKDRLIAKIEEEAKLRAERMNMKMEDQLIEGGFHKAFSEFIDDLTVFPSAIMKGPVVRMRSQLKWTNGELTVEDQLRLEWERVDPFMLYPAPVSTDVEDDYLIERHKLSRTSLNAMIGVEGYNDGAIRAVLDEYGRGGLKNWLMVDSARESTTTVTSALTDDSTIEAIQFWGSVQGKMLLEWGMDEESVEDPTKEYNVEVWLVGTWVIKATINPDPLGRKPYYKASYEEIPGEFWGNSIMDLVRDCQLMCNAAARALANNMGLASGPQVEVQVDRLAAGEDITQIHPGKIWQTTSDPMGTSQKRAIEFFVPPSLSQELVGVFEHFSSLADEYSGIPRYMTGNNNVGGAARTASGMSMLLNNAGKGMKQVVAYVDNNVLQPMIERLYNHNMRYSDDPELKGDVAIIARGANALIVKEQAQVRRNEFLQIALASPQVFELVGMRGLAELLRPIAADLDIDPDKLIPPEPIIKQREQAKQMAMAMMAMGGQAPGQPQGVDGKMQPKRDNVGSGQQLANGQETTDNFQPKRRG